MHPHPGSEPPAPQGEADTPDWFDLEIWGKTAEVASEYVRKGSLIGVTGQLSFSRWQDKTTQEAKERAVIKVDRLKLLGSKRDNSGNQDTEEQPF